MVLLLLIALVAGGVLLGARAAAFNATVTDTPFISTALLGPLNGSDRVNVMMVGYGGADHDGAYLADSIQVLSIDPTTNTTTTIPIPRDLWVEGVEAFSQNGKINEVFSAGQAANGEIDDGAAAPRGCGQRRSPASRSTTGSSIDFQGFRGDGRRCGRRHRQNPTAFCYTTVESLHHAGQWGTGCYEAGTLELNGASALAYARARYTSDVTESTDFARSVRQARIIGSLKSTLGDGGLASIGPGLGLMDAMEGRVRTDLSVIDLFLLSGHLSSDRRMELSEGPVLTATTNSIGQYILVPTGWIGPGDYGGIRAYLATELAAPVGAASDAP